MVSFTENENLLLNDFVVNNSAVPFLFIMFVHVLNVLFCLYFIVSALSIVGYFLVSVLPPFSVVGYFVEWFGLIIAQLVR